MSTIVIENEGDNWGVKNRIDPNHQIDFYSDLNNEDKLFMQFPANISSIDIDLDETKKNIQSARVHGTHDLYEPQKHRFLRQPIDKLSDAKWLIIKSEPSTSKPSLQMEKYWASFQKIRIKIFVNRVLAIDHVVENPSFTIQQTAWFGSERWQFISRTDSVEGIMKNIRSLYEGAILRQSNAEKIEDEHIQNN